jgi:small subunit ribosomal protein S9
MSTTEPKVKYFEAVGRRKTAIARIRMTPATKTTVSVNDKDLEKYFPTLNLQKVAMSAIELSKIAQKFKITAKMIGGGINGQAEAFRHGTARALIIYDKELRKKVKKLGLLTRDPRAKERRKFGLKKARKSPQWSKR